MLAECAFAQLQQAMSRGRSDGPELEEFLTRIGHHRQWADLALWMADAEVEQVAQERRRARLAATRAGSWTDPILGK